jgi:hypothetical protein
MIALHSAGIVARGIQVDPSFDNRCGIAELAELFIVARDGEIAIARYGRLFANSSMAVR